MLCRNNGLVALVADDIFDQMKERHTENWWLGLSYLEIYNGEGMTCHSQKLLRRPSCLYACALLTHEYTSLACLGG